MIDNRNSLLKENFDLHIEQLCHRRFGIGADGLIILNPCTTADFEMVYYNSDGRKSTMCGNGGRCIVMFAKDIGIIENRCSFLAVDGYHTAVINANNSVSLKMQNVESVKPYGNDFVTNTGSPHYVSFCNAVNDIDIVKEAHSIRYNDDFKSEGINVNFVEKTSHNSLYVRTYERGVEDETYSCGTGVVASAICFANKNGTEINEVDIETPGGKLKVNFESHYGKYLNVVLTGPAVHVFDGVIKL